MIEARLKKLRTDDGLVEMEEHIQLGKIYLVDENSMQQVGWHNFIAHKTVTRASICADNGEWLPLELLDLGKEHL